MQGKLIYLFLQGIFSSFFRIVYMSGKKGMLALGSILSASTSCQGDFYGQFCSINDAGKYVLWKMITCNGLEQESVFFVFSACLLWCCTETFIL